MNNWKYTAAVLGLTLLLATGCQSPGPVTDPPTDPPTAPMTEPVTDPTTDPVTEPATEPPTEPATEPTLTGWQEVDGKRYYYDEKGNRYLGWLTAEEGTYYLDFDGAAATGWIDIGDHTYFFEETGLMHTGWLSESGRTYYFHSSGIMAQGWTWIDECQYYFAGDGAMHTGWLYRDGSTYYFLSDGTMTQGWNWIDGDQYYFYEDGTMHTGWLYWGSDAYYFLSDGTGAVGTVEIGGQTCHFSPSGIYVVLVNPWNYMPEDYDTEIVYVEGEPISSECADALRAMLAACREDGCDPVFLSGYRSIELQTALYEDNIQKYLDRGYDYDTAVELAGRSVAIPGTSEHQLGLAVDIVDNYNWSLDESQEDTATQKWLMEHCWEYGFILRYPNGTTDITGIIYEPWHYRYVGTEIALDLRDLGITLEEYLGAA